MQYAMHPGNMRLVPKMAKKSRIAQTGNASARQLEAMEGGSGGQVRSSQVTCTQTAARFGTAVTHKHYIAHACTMLSLLSENLAIERWS